MGTLFGPDFFLFFDNLRPSVVARATFACSSTIKLGFSSFLENDQRIPLSSMVNTYELGLSSIMGFVSRSEVSVVLGLVWLLWSLDARVGSWRSSGVGHFGSVPFGSVRNSMCVGVIDQ